MKKKLGYNSLARQTCKSGRVITIGIGDFFHLKKKENASPIIEAQRATLDKKKKSNKLPPFDPDKQSPVEYDDALFARFYRDLRSNALPTIPEPTQKEITKYKNKRKEMASNRLNDSTNIEALKSNYSIPVEIDIWVDKVFAYYFDDLIPYLGLVHSCQGAKRELYKYKGYTWYTLSELHPFIMFD